MPYRVRGRSVQVKRKGRWRNFKTHRSHAAAVRQIRAMYFSGALKHKKRKS